jgi:hypothetical protein
VLWHFTAAPCSGVIHCVEWVVVGSDWLHGWITNKCDSPFRIEGWTRLFDLHGSFHIGIVDDDGLEMHRIVLQFGLRSNGPIIPNGAVAGLVDDLRRIVKSMIRDRHGSDGLLLCLKDVW